MESSGEESPKAMQCITAHTRVEKVILDLGQILIKISSIRCFFGKGMKVSKMLCITIYVGSKLNILTIAGLT